MQTPSQPENASAHACTAPSVPAIPRNEDVLIATLKAIYLETMDYSPIQRSGSDSHLPADLVEKAKNALALYGVVVTPYNETGTEPASADACTAPPPSAAVLHILKQLNRDPRLAYLIGPGSESFALLTAEYAQAKGLDAEKLRIQMSANLKFEAWPDEYDIQCRINEAVAKAFTLRGAA